MARHGHVSMRVADARRLRDLLASSARTVDDRNDDLAPGFTRAEGLVEGLETYRIRWALAELADRLAELGRDLEWRIDLLVAGDTTPLPDGRVSAWLPDRPPGLHGLTDAALLDRFGDEPWKLDDEALAALLAESAIRARLDPAFAGAWAAHLGPDGLEELARQIEWRIFDVTQTASLWNDEQWDQGAIPPDWNDRRADDPPDLSAAWLGADPVTALLAPFASLVVEAVDHGRPPWIDEWLFPEAPYEDELGRVALIASQVTVDADLAVRFVDYILDADPQWVIAAGSYQPSQNGVPIFTELRDPVAAVLFLAARTPDAAHRVLSERPIADLIDRWSDPDQERISALMAGAALDESLGALIDAGWVRYLPEHPEAVGDAFDQYLALAAAVEGGIELPGDDTATALAGLTNLLWPLLAPVHRSLLSAEQAEVATSPYGSVAPQATAALFAEMVDHDAALATLAAGLAAWTDSIVAASVHHLDGDTDVAGAADAVADSWEHLFRGLEEAGRADDPASLGLLERAMTAVLREGLRNGVRALGLSTGPGFVVTFIGGELITQLVDTLTTPLPDGHGEDPPSSSGFYFSVIDPDVAANPDGSNPARRLSIVELSVINAVLADPPAAFDGVLRLPDDFPWQENGQLVVPDDPEEAAAMSVAVTRWLTDGDVVDLALWNDLAGLVIDVTGPIADRIDLGPGDR